MVTVRVERVKSALTSFHHRLGLLWLRMPKTKLKVWLPSGTEAFRVTTSGSYAASMSWTFGDSAGRNKDEIQENMVK